MKQASASLSLLRDLRRAVLGDTDGNGKKGQSQGKYERWKLRTRSSVCIAYCLIHEVRERY